jgi:hypothetical protein
MAQMRAFIRHPSDIPIELIVERRSGRANGKLQNVSLGGLACQAAGPLDVGTIVRVRVSSVRPPFESKGTVVWCRGRDRHFEVGIQFLEAEDAFKARMVEQVCHIEHYKREVREKEGRVLSGQEAALEWIAKYAPEFPNLGLPETKGS